MNVLTSASVACIACILFFHAGDRAAAQDFQPSMEDSVVADLKMQRSGYGTLADLDYPEDYLRRLADRILRSSFERRFRAVIRNPETEPEIEGPPAPPGIRSSSQPASRPVLPDHVKIRNHRPDRARLWVSDRRPEEFPIAFRPPIFDDSSRQAVLAEFAGLLGEVERKAAEHVASHLARDGLIETLISTIELIGPDRFLAPMPASGDPTRRLLRGIGIPLDLLASFRMPDGKESVTPTMIARRLADGQGGALRKDLAEARFEFHAAIPGFRAFRDDGGDKIGGLRLQMTRGGAWIGVGDGGSVDIGRQLAKALPETPLFVSIQDAELDEFKIALAEWSRGRSAPIVVALEPFEVAQWAQDNARNGVIVAGGESGKVATLVPRFTCRGEIGAQFASGEAQLLESFSAEGHRCAQSRLLFQGGDLLFVRDPAKRENVLVMGEAEVWRNRALGLTRQQVLDAYRAEFGADRCVVLPTISFHVDYEVTFREVDGRLVAFVNDPLAAGKIVAKTGVDTLARLGFIDNSAAAALRSQLEAGEIGDFVNRIGTALIGRAIGAGVYDERFAEQFTSGASGESGVANFQSMLLSLDVLLNSSLPDDQVPQDNPGAFIRAWRRYLADLKGLHAALEAEGWRVVPVPSISNGERSLNYLNGLHAPGAYYMPAIGGMMQDLDRAAATVFRETLGAQVQVTPVLTGESQRRHGALRCAVSAIPAGE